MPRSEADNARISIFTACNKSDSRVTFDIEHVFESITESSFSPWVPWLIARMVLG